MDVSEPTRCLTPTLEGPALEVLVRTAGPLAGREVARLARSGSEAGIRLALHRLVAQGVVTAEERGGALLYALNRDHLALPAIVALVGLRDALAERLGALVTAWAEQPIHASLFGSYARRDGDAESDIDVLLIRPSGIAEDAAPWAEQVDDLRERVRRWTGNHCQVYQTDQRGFATHVRTKAGIVQEWLRDSITVCGPNVAALVINARARGRR